MSVVAVENAALNCIGGEWRRGNSTESLNVFNPATSEVLAHGPMAGRDDVAAAVAAASAAFPVWRWGRALGRFGRATWRFRRLDGARVRLRYSPALPPAVDPADYLETLRATRADDSPGRWAELLASQPWMHKRMQALDLFARSAVWADLGGEVAGEKLSAEELARRTDTLLAVG